MPHITSVTLPKTDVSLLIRANENTMCLAQGSACSAKEIEPSHVLSALGLNREQADRTIRLSLPIDCSKNDIDYLVSKIIECS